MKSPHVTIIAAALALLPTQAPTIAQTTEAAALQLEAKIPLGNVNGRIDHMAIDLARQRLFVAELGNNSIGIVALNNRRLLRNIEELKEPQGVAYVPSTDTLYVANAADGSVRLFIGPDHAAAGLIDLQDAEDNIRVN